MKNLIYLLALSSFVLLAGCEKNIIEEIEDSLKSNYTSNIFGTVIDEKNIPVEGAEVIYRNHKTTTDKFGVYMFRDVQVSSKHNIITIKKESYYDEIVDFLVNSNEKTVISNASLNRLKYSLSIRRANLEYSIRNSDFELYIQPNSFVHSETGVEFNSFVRIDVGFLIDSSDIVGYTTSLQAIDEDFVNVTLYPEVYMNFEFRRSIGINGALLELKNGSPISISLEIPERLKFNTPEILPLWYFDSESGYMRPKGHFTLVDGRYVGSIDKSGNYVLGNKSNNSITLSGKLVDKNNNPMSQYNICFYSGETNRICTMTTLDGTYVCKVGKNETYHAKVYNNVLNESRCELNVENSRVGSFYGDTHLSDIVVDVENDDFYKIDTKFFDCSGTLLENGYARMFNQDNSFLFFPIIKGSSNLHMSVCNKEKNYRIMALDLQSSLESDPVTIVEGEQQINNISICRSFYSVTTVRCEELNFYDTLYSSQFYAFSNFKDTVKIFVAYGPSLTSAVLDHIYFGYKDDRGNGFMEGTYVPSVLDIRYYHIPGISSSHIRYTNGIINIKNSGFIGDIMQGTFQFDANDYKFEGEISVKFENR